MGAFAACLPPVLGGVGWLAVLALAVQPLAAWRAGLEAGAACVAAAGLAAAATILTVSPGAFRPEDGPALVGLALAGLALHALGPLALALFPPRAGPAPEPASIDAPILDAVADLVTWHGSAGDVVGANAAAYAFLGAAPETLVGSGLLQHVHVSDRPAFLKALDDAAAGLDPACLRLRLHAHRGGSPQTDSDAIRPMVTWVEIRARPAPGAVDGRRRVVTVIRDISAERRQTDEVEAARLSAERANELKGRFLATVSHELRTPLNAIIGFSELMAGDHPYILTDERRKEYATIIRDSGQHLLEIVNTLLDMSKIESGNFEVAPEAFAPGELAAACCDLVQLKAEAAGITFVRDIAADLPEIVTDRRACRQILINLLSNALKFTPQGGTVTIAVGRRSNRLVLEVADTGIGIAEPDLPRLGDPFFQAGDVHRRRHEGTGLGLSVVRGLVGLLGGTMSIESGPDAGTTVVVALPIQSESARLVPRPVQVQTRARPPAAPRERMIA
jgi:cell cycle sensor histidine kinase DivJ